MFERVPPGSGPRRVGRSECRASVGLLPLTQTVVTILVLLLLLLWTVVCVAVLALFVTAARGDAAQPHEHTGPAHRFSTERTAPPTKQWRTARPLP
jgi:hypothetical protein